MGRQGQTVQPYKPMKRSLFRILAPVIILLLLVLASSMSSRAQAGEPYSLIDAVNGLRAANGLPAYQINNILMSIAQGHSDYMAAIGSVTHYGAGGSLAEERAAAAGYGGGGTFHISENICGGVDYSIEDTINCWLQDDEHIQTMLGPNYRDIGAGVTEAGGWVYYTIDVAYVAGSGNYVPPNTVTPGGPTAIPIHLVQTSTPNPDGSVIHIVLYGQYLSTIATAYGLTLAEIMDLNHLTNDKIYEGDKLIIRLANTPGPTSTATGTSTPTRAATATHKPTRTPSPTASPVVTSTGALTADPVQISPGPERIDWLGNILVIAIVVMAVGGVVLMVLGSVIRRSNKD